LIFPLAHRRPTGPFAEPRPSMNGRYLLRSKRAARMIATMDAALSLVPVRKRAPDNRVRRILLANWGHLGDVVMTFGVITALRQRYPNVEIGMIVSSWAKAAIKDVNIVDHIHVVDHWWVSRANLTKREKKKRFFKTRDTAICEIRAIGYDIAIDLYPFFPPAHPLFFKARIPVRVGFTSGGFGPLLTHPVSWSDADLPIAEQFRPLLNAWHPYRHFSAMELRPRRLRDTLVPPPPQLTSANPYIVLHPGAGATYKEWGVDRWHKAIDQIQKAWPAYRIVLTGAGAVEEMVARELHQSFPGLINLVGRVGWEPFVTTIANAKAVVCPDTAAGHVAALFDVPVVSIFTGTNNALQWRPYTDKLNVLIQPVVCAPCNGPGCTSMMCIRGVMPEDMIASLRRVAAPLPLGA
jgi:ADP-heptose:LPS heptosyltransferase